MSWWGCGMRGRLRCRMIASIMAMIPLTGGAGARMPTTCRTWIAQSGGRHYRLSLLSRSSGLSRKESSALFVGAGQFDHLAGRRLARTPSGAENIAHGRGGSNRLATRACASRQPPPFAPQSGSVSVRRASSPHPGAAAPRVALILTRQLELAAPRPAAAWLRVWRVARGTPHPRRSAGARSLARSSGAPTFACHRCGVQPGRGFAPCRHEVAAGAARCSPAVRRRAPA